MAWPAAAYVYLTWAYALARAREQATQRGQRVYVRRAKIEGRWMWITSWDRRPKEEQ